MIYIPSIEKRTLSIREVQTNDDSLTVSGYVNKNGSISEVLSEDNQIFQETILPQAFTKALGSGQDIDFYLEHDPSKILASTKNGSLTLNQDNTGLHMTATIVPTSDGNDAYELIKSGIVSSMSFGFFVLGDTWDYDTEIPLRTVTELDLIEVSAVQNPAYTSSEINARCKKQDKKVKIRGLSHINLSDKGGEKLAEDKFKDFSIDDLKAELDKRSKDDNEKNKEAEPKEAEVKEARGLNPAVDVNEMIALARSCVDLVASTKAEKRSTDEPVEPANEPDENSETNENEPENEPDNKEELQSRASKLGDFLKDLDEK